MSVLERLQELLLPVFGLDSIEEVQPQFALVNDLGADSIDFVEIVYLIEKNFSVSLKTDEMILGGVVISSDTLFENGLLSAEGVEHLKSAFPDRADEFQADTSKVNLFAKLTIADLAQVIEYKQNEI
ncbi:MAG: phosphopantetheine-binding protein [Campylobacterota bacterium]|nr:phosphopantetheine-binding protein [Campylobacterota bacterium]